MFKKYLTLIIVVLIINLTLGSSAFAGTKEEKDVKFAERVKTSITKLGTGNDAKVEVKLKDGTKLKGYVSEITDDHFSVMDSKTGTATAVDITTPNRSKEIIFRPKQKLQSQSE